MTKYVFTVIPQGKPQRIIDRNDTGPNKGHRLNYRRLARLAAMAVVFHALDSRGLDHGQYC